MQYSAAEAATFGQRMLEAGRIAKVRNARANERWSVDADPDTMEVSLHGEISEDISVFLSQRMEF